MHKNQKVLMADVKAAIELQAETGMSFKETINLVRYDFNTIREAIDCYDTALQELVTNDPVKFKAVKEQYGRVREFATNIAHQLLKK